jgi:hypothetical protein
VLDGFIGVVAWVKSIQGMISEAERQAEGLFESLLSVSFGFLNSGYRGQKGLQNET